MTAELYDEHEDNAHVAEVIAYTAGQSDAERDHAAGEVRVFDSLAGLDEDARTTYEAGYVAGYRQAIERASFAAAALYRQPATVSGVTFDRAVNVGNDEHIETSGYVARDGRIVTTEVVKVHRDGTRERIGFTNGSAPRSRVARIIANLRERFNQWRQ